MWISSPTEQDEPITLPLWGIRYCDFAIALGVFLFFFLVLSRTSLGLTATPLGFVVACAVLFLLHQLKKGTPPGQHWHWLHHMHLWWIPGALPSREQHYRIW